MRGLSSLLRVSCPRSTGRWNRSGQVFDADGLDGLLVAGGIEFGQGLGAELLEVSSMGKREG